MPASLLGLGGGMIVNGLLNALVSSVNARKSVAANAEQQQKNLEFQEAQQKKQWEHAEMLQREMRELTRRNFLEQIEHQRQTADIQALEQRWPLPATSPRLIINEFNDYLKSGRPIPLQLIVVENGELGRAPLSIRAQVRNAINELNKFMSVHYGQNSPYAVKIYDTDKSGANFGASEVDTIFQVFKVAPTMILTARVYGAEYVLESWFWGSGVATKPVMVELFRCDVEELQLTLLKEIATDWSIAKEKLAVDDSEKDALVDLVKRIENERQRLVKRGATPEEVREYGVKPFTSQIAEFASKKSFIKKINVGIERSLLSSFKICSSLLADVHFLLEYKAAPRFMQICKDELSHVPHLVKHSEAFFSSAIEKLPDFDYHKPGKTLMHARLASAYQDAAMPDRAMKYSLVCARELEALVNPENFALEASGDMLQSLDTLKQISGIDEQVPWIIREATRLVSPDELNRYAASLYREQQVDKAVTVWRKAVEQGHIKSMHNLAMVLESENRREDANVLYTKAIKCGDLSLYFRGHDLAVWHCARGEWATAFSMWCAYLQSEDRRYRSFAEAYSAAIIFTEAHTDISKSDYCWWMRLMTGTEDCDSPQNTAEDFLLSRVQNENGRQDSNLEPFYDVLAMWYLKSRGMQIPFIYGVSEDLKLNYILPENLPHNFEELFQVCISKSGRCDIRAGVRSLNN